MCTIYNNTNYNNRETLNDWPPMCCEKVVVSPKWDVIVNYFVNSIVDGTI